MVQGTPLITGSADVPPFDRAALIIALQTDQAGESSFLAFLAPAWKAGVIRYDVNLAERVVAYYGGNEEEYSETYPAVAIALL